MALVMPYPIQLSIQLFDRQKVLFGKKTPFSFGAN